MTVLIFAVSLATILTGKTAVASFVAPTSVDSESIKLSALGYCRSATGYVDMAAVIFLSQNFAYASSSTRVSVSNDTVIIEDITNENSGRLIYNIRSMVRKGDDPDVKVQLVLVGGELAVFWRETFLHREYRQGIFGIGAGKLIPMCEGVGGTSTFH